MRCANYTSKRRGAQCSRDAAGGAKYCRICTAAIARGERFIEDRLAAQEQRIARQEAIRLARNEIVDAACEARLHLELTPRLVAALNAFEKAKAEIGGKGVTNDGERLTVL